MASIARTVPRTPTTFGELLKCLPGLEGVRFTGDRQAALELDELAGVRRRVWARKTWEALQALSGYARAKADGRPVGSFLTYCRDGSAGPVISAQRLVPGESRQVQIYGKWVEQRMFPVPASVHPQGAMLMLAHVRIDSRGAAPRLYYLDLTGHGQGVLVGRIGRHLTNTIT
ncbi:hypothetical protein [Nocardiopsis synnemataformans]|uniref:hypothetical protein n=1 Tax=Nocardiopsis synnemataformans TaxID=61305 RepID=UPI003EBA6495